MQDIATKHSADRVRRHTAHHVNRSIDAATAERIRFFAKGDDEAISRRLAQLDREWDMERVLETNASSLALAGTVLGAAIDRRWLALPMLVTGFLLQHAIQGWCPPVVVFRRMGVRTRQEIEKERYALKMLRGDFDHGKGDQDQNVEGLLVALDL